MVKRLAKKVGIVDDIHPLTLRHTFATDIYRETKNIRRTEGFGALGFIDYYDILIL
jgi:site-specific recombinase XerD